MLNFRSPKERTPDPYDIRVRFDGSPLEFSKAKSPKFSKEKRFKQYESDAHRTSSMIGPGSYSSLKSPKVKGTILYKPVYGLGKDYQDCFYVGQLLIKEIKNSKTSDSDSSKKLDISRPTTASDNISGSPYWKSSKRIASLGRNYSRNRLIPRID